MRSATAATTAHERVTQGDASTLLRQRQPGQSRGLSSLADLELFSGCSLERSPFLDETVGEAFFCLRIYGLGFHQSRLGHPVRSLVDGLHNRRKQIVGRGLDVVSSQQIDRGDGRGSSISELLELGHVGQQPQTGLRHDPP